MRFLTRVLIVVLSLAPLAAQADPGVDRNIEELAAASYNFRVVLEKQVTVKAENGAVTLIGAVLDEDQKALAEATAQTLPGVTQVINQLQVTSPAPEASDGWMALKIRSILLVRANVNADKTEIVVRAGHVTLTGTANSIEQKQLTEACVREVPGVKSIQNQMVVNAADTPANTSAEAKIPDLIDDASITAQIKHALASGRIAHALEATVATHNGAVQLSGATRTDAERERVTQLVRTIRGVTSVDNAMIIQAAE